MSTSLETIHNGPLPTNDNISIWVLKPQDNSVSTPICHTNVRLLDKIKYKFGLWYITLLIFYKPPQPEVDSWVNHFTFGHLWIPCTHTDETCPLPIYFCEGAMRKPSAVGKNNLFLQTWLDKWHIRDDEVDGRNYCGMTCEGLFIHMMCHFAPQDKSSSDTTKSDQPPWFGFSSMSAKSRIKSRSWWPAGPQKSLMGGCIRQLRRVRLKETYHSPPPPPPPHHHPPSPWDWKIDSHAVYIYCLPF